MFQGLFIATFTTVTMKLAYMLMKKERHCELNSLYKFEKNL